VAKSRRRPSRPKPRAAKKASSARKKASKAKALPKGSVDLNKHRAQIAGKLALFQKMEPTDHIKRLIDHHHGLMATLDSLCDPNNSDGCGPDMIFPRPFAV
jgi:hypothetical protein